MKRILSLSFSCVFVFMLALPCFIFSASAVDDLTLNFADIASLASSGYVSSSSSFYVLGYTSDGVSSGYFSYVDYGSVVTQSGTVVRFSSSRSSSGSSSYFRVFNQGSGYPVRSGYVTVGITVDLSSYGIFYSLSGSSTFLSFGIGSSTGSYITSSYLYDVYVGSDLVFSSFSNGGSFSYSNSNGFTSFSIYLYIPSSSNLAGFSSVSDLFLVAPYAGTAFSITFFSSSLYTDASNTISSGSSSASGANQQLQEIEDQFIDSATEAFDDINWDLELTSDMTSSMTTVTDTMSSFWNSLGDFQYMIIFPLMLGIILLLAGRVSKSKSGGDG